ncbi:glycosyltransferase family A protein [Bradyrhizobium sp. NBAIM08]|uniref:glycosyltransferase family 2 protein n=1 Tax=Bradyrhizobium sp. NBAIM08 TaxID=2793815 RepID=UPI001CD419E4|nr:glycosyltransferase family A protein [Bradyrhizobium sp. NBAIM08]MCA1476785.1 glycosyltransferase family 2 protein [Bradyrhizobium sp. NBAIM08]
MALIGPITGVGGTLFELYPDGATIAVACYNAGSYLAECLTSILEPPLLLPHEVIVINDGSDDPTTLRILSRFEANKTIRVIHHDRNVGLAGARNSGLFAARRNYVMFVDADDCLNRTETVLKEGDYLDRAVTALRSDPALAFTHCATLMFGDCCGYTSSAYPLTEELVAAKHHVPASIVFRTEDAIELGGFKPSIVKWTDWSFGASLLSHRLSKGLANEIAYFATPYYLYRTYRAPHRVSQKSVSEQEMIRRTVESFRPLFSKYYPGLDDTKVSERVLAAKPSLLKCLAYMAKADLARAIQFIRERDLDRLLGDRSTALAP